MSESDIHDGMLHVRQGKTKARLRIVLEGGLAELVEELRAYKRDRQIGALALLVDESGQPLRIHTLRYRFDKARRLAGVPKAEFQFRDLRAKAATDLDEAGGTTAAQALLGHSTEAMTAHYIRNKVGRKVRTGK